MPLESGTYISDLVATNPVHTDGLNQADSHLRLIKAALKATFPNLKGAVTASQDLLNTVTTAFATAGQLIIPGTTPITLTNSSGTLKVSGAVSAPSLTVDQSITIGGKDVAASMVPSGSILIWSGAATNIPSQWVLCDGTKGTPDLRDRFIVGATLSYSVGNTGGGTTGRTDTQGAHTHGGATGAGGAFTASAQTDSQGSHSHGGNTQATALTLDQLPSHVHSAPRSATASVQTGSGTSVTLVEINGVSATNGPNTSSTGSGNSHSHPIGSDGQHSHGVSISAGNHAHSISSDGAHAHSVSTVPPYYALCYIMKT